MKKIFSRSILCLLIVLTAAPGLSANVTDLKKKIDSNASGAAESKSRLAAARLEKNEVLAEVAELDIELEAVTEEIEFIIEELEKTMTQLAQTELDLLYAEQSRANQFEALKSRVRYMHENGVSGYLQILFKSSSVSDFLNRYDYINQVIAYDKTLFDKLKETENYIAKKKDDREKQKREQEVLKNQELARKASLEEARAKKNEMIKLLSQEEKRYQQQIEEFEAENKRIEQRIKEAEEEAKRLANTVSVYTGGAIGWPVPSSQRVTSGFGNRTNPINKRPENHKGIDIGALYGANIVAAEGGTVLSAEWSGSYGNMVIIMHGGGLSTVYAHCSSLLVSRGSVVSKGQTIAKVGSTGYSTGNHLHFEVRFNGVAQNPIGTYLNKR